ncbi:MAG TPA: tetratricopeptide repeat protein, partial [Isosphaeraceae bacterium]|nr:tetratricopeptide repeat protein [Isosphaeraceae bacterium]
MSLASSVTARATVRRRIFPGILAALVLAACARLATADEKPPPQASVRTLQGDDAQQVESLTQTIDRLKSAGQFAEAVEPARKVLAICQKGLGPDQWQTADASRTVDDLRMMADLPEDGRKALGSVRILDQKADSERRRGHYAEAERIDRALLEIRRKWLGEAHPVTALSSNNLAYDLDHQGKHAAAETLFRQALAIRLKALGEAHPDTAHSSNNLAHLLGAQGKYVEAEPLLRQALAIRLRALGEGHPHTATSYNNLAADLDAQGKYTAAEPLFRQALAIWLKALGEAHPDTATGYNNLALNLGAQGKYAEAEPLFRQALAIRLKALGEAHPDTAQSHNNLAADLDAQGKYTAAEPLFRQALAIYLKALGKDHPDTALGYNNLAYNLGHQGKHDAAEPLLRQALAIWLKALGEAHPKTALGYNNLAFNLDVQGKPVEAEPLHRQALAIRLQALGESHPLTAASYKNLAANLDAQGKFTEAVANWTAAAAVYERARGARGASGLERSLTAISSPLPALAITLARQGQPRQAWDRWESNLARGLLDDLSAQSLRPLTSEERSREADLIGQLQRLDERTTRLAAKARRTPDQDQQFHALRQQQSALRGQWVEFQNEMDRQYRAFAGKPSTLQEVQRATPPDAALLGWLDVKAHHWACM